MDPVAKMVSSEKNKPRYYWCEICGYGGGINDVAGALSMSNHLNYVHNMWNLSTDLETGHIYERVLGHKKTTGQTNLPRVIDQGIADLIAHLCRIEDGQDEIDGWKHPFGSAYWDLNCL